MKSVQLNSTFWTSFAKNHWESRPWLGCLAPTSILSLDRDAVFSMLVAYSDRCRKNKSVDGMKLFVDGVRQYDEEALQVLPVKKDKSLMGFHQRISQIYPDYCLVCDELLQVSEDHWKALTDFVGGLYSQIGLPYRFAEMGLYLGNYRKTPFGVHVDGCGVFSFPLVGEKKFRLWTAEFADQNPKLKESFRYSKFLKGSELFVVRPGDMSYWPSSAWHIAESDGSFSATWSLGVWVDRKQEDFLREALEPLLVEAARGGATAIESAAQELPTELNRSILAIKNISQKQMHSEILKAWLAHKSKQGFKTGPVLAGGGPLVYKTKIRGRLSQPIFWQQDVADKLKTNLVLAFAGKTRETSISEALTSMIAELNQGKVVDLAKFFSRSEFKSQTSTLAWLSEIGAIQVASSRAK